MHASTCAVISLCWYRNIEKIQYTDSELLMFTMRRLGRQRQTETGLFQVKETHVIVRYYIRIVVYCLLNVRCAFVSVSLSKGNYWERNCEFDNLLNADMAKSIHRRAAFDFSPYNTSEFILSERRWSVYLFCIFASLLHFCLYLHHLHIATCTLTIGNFCATYVA